MPPNFALLDPTLPDVARLIAAMVQPASAKKEERILMFFREEVRRKKVPISSLLRRNPTKLIPLILISVLSAASACYAADPTLDKGNISSGAPTHGVVLHLHGCDGLVRSG